MRGFARESELAFLAIEFSAPLYQLGNVPGSFFHQCANRVLIAEEGWATFGVGAELAARVGRACFDDLDAPPERVGGAEVPMPYSKPLELAALMLEDKLEAAARSLLAESGLVATGGD